MHYYKHTTVFLVFALLMITHVSVAQSKAPEQFIPKGWKSILKEKGDLNKDKLDDLVMVIEKDDPSNLKLNEGFGMDTLNLNPRTILVLFKQKEGGYKLIAQNNKGFIERENSDENPCLADPLMWNGLLKIEKGILVILFNYWLSCGSWFVNNATYKFRFQNNAMELIGFDHSEFHRASGESSATSINFSTKKIEETTGLNMFEDDEGKAKTTWRKISFPKLLQMQNLDEETYFKVTDL